jgi:hypothetical protein
LRLQQQAHARLPTSYGPGNDTEWVALCLTFDQAQDEQQDAGADSRNDDVG